jgi:serine/threonine protein phosphatase PrpC
METLSGVKWFTGKNRSARGKPYEDRSVMLTSRAPLVARAGRGHLFAVMDGIGDAPRAMHAAQCLADRLINFYRKTSDYPATPHGLRQLIIACNDEVNGWGVVEGTNLPLGLAAFTVAWFSPEQVVHIFHAGNTVGMLFDGKEITRLTPRDPAPSGVVNYLGCGKNLSIHHIPIKLTAGESIVLVSDGIIPKAMHTHDARDVLLDREAIDPEAAARLLAERAQAFGSRDDITAMVIELEAWDE